MTASPIRQRLATFLFAMLALAAGWAHADPPSRVARLAYVSGAASFSPGGERDWGHAVVNRPLITGDRLWVDRGSRAELQLGTAAIRVGASTSLSLLNLDDRATQVELTQGTLNIRVRRLDRGEVFEVDTPNLAYSIRRPGNYRIEVDSDGRVTTVTARAGLAEVYGEGRAFVTSERRTYRFYDSSLRDYEVFGSVAMDDLDRWSAQRDRRWDASPSRRYVSAEIIGYEDLDQNGTWRKVANYGNVWVPNRVPAGWAPYRDGHWAWIEPWGWTWVDDAPWGFAPSHYGRWAFVDRTWAWVPGPANTRPVYAPALVAFVSGGGGNIGWFPLGPRDVYRPSYSASREYYDRVNMSNTVVDRTVIANSYSNRNANNATYVNQQVPGAVIAMLAAAFSQSRPVAKENVRVTQESFARAPVTAVAPVAPVHASVVAAPSNTKPPEATVTRRVVAQVAPPPPPVAFAAKQRELAANAGKPLEPAAIAALKPAASAPAPTVKVVEATKPIPAPSAPAAPASGRAPRASAASNAATASAPAAAPPGAPAAASAPAPASAATASRPSTQQRPASQSAPPQQPSQPASHAAPSRAASAPNVAPQAATAPELPRANRPANTPAAGERQPPATQQERGRGRPAADEERGRGRPASAPPAPEAARPAPPAVANTPAPAAAPPAPEAPPARTRPTPPPQASPAARSTQPPPSAASTSPPSPAAATTPPPPAPAPTPRPPPPVAPAPAREAPASVSKEPAPPAARPALPPAAPMATPPARAPSAAAPAAQERGGRARGPEAGASARREPASDEKRRGRGEEERKP